MLKWLPPAAVLGLALTVSPHSADARASGPPGPGMKPGAVALRAFSASRVAPRQVALRWRTKAESGLVGFDLFRRQGGVARISKLSIAARNAARGATYTYSDRSVGRGHAQYRLEAVLLDGTRIWLGSASVRRAS